MDKLGRMQQLFDEVLLNNKELRRKITIRGLNENDRRTYENIRWDRIGCLQGEQDSNNKTTRWLWRGARRGNTFRYKSKEIIR